MNLTSFYIPINESMTPPVVTTNDLVNLCGVFSGQAKVGAIVGILLAIMAMFWFSTRIPYRTDMILRGEETATTIIDKVLLIGIAMCFALIIARLYYAG